MISRDEAAPAARPSRAPEGRPGPGAALRQSLRGRPYAQQSRMLSPRSGGAAAGGAAGGAAAGGAAAGGATGHPTLRQGSRGPAVRDLQQRLVQQGAALDADGAFGPATRRAVVAWQAGHGLGADGVVGPLTWSALQGGGGGPAAAPGAGGPSPVRMASVAGKLRLLKQRLGAQSAAGRQAPVPEAGPARSAPPGGGSSAAAPSPRPGFLDDVGDAAGEAWDSATETAGEAWDTAKAGAETVWDAGTEVAGEAVDLARQGAETVWDAGTGAAEAAWEGAREVAGGARDVAEGAWDAAKSGAESAWDTARDVASNVGEAAGEGYGIAAQAGGEAWEGVKGAADEVRSGVEGLAADVRERYGADIDRLMEALGDLGRPLTVDLGAVESTLDRLLAGLDPGAGLAEVKAPPPDVEDAVAGDYDFTVTQPPKRQSTAVSGATLQDLKVAIEAASKAQASGGARFLFVQPSPFKTSDKKVDKYGRVIGLKVQTQETLGIPNWTQYAANPAAWHPLAQQSWDTARQGMDVHEAGHLSRDQAAYTAAAVQEKVHGKPQAEIGKALDAIEADAKSSSDSWDAQTEHGVMGDPSTVVRIPHFQTVEEWNKAHPEDKDKKL
jgi:peptidoglycan hydrolase-like protein with peptidoglycan-binding domain